MKEANIRNNIIKHACTLGWRLFNNPQGVAYVGRYDAAQKVVRFPRVMRFGLGTGTSDLIGWRPVEITQDMVGKTIAQFTAVEVKKDKHGAYKETAEQKAFGAFVNKSGGCYICADKEEDLK